MKKTSAAPSPSSTAVSDQKEDVKAEEDTPRARFNKYLNELDEKYPNHNVMVLESLPSNDEDEEDEDEESDKVSNEQHACHACHRDDAMMHALNML